MQLTSQTCCHGNDLHGYTIETVLMETFNVWPITSSHCYDVTKHVNQVTP